jgi:hypothetical protein
MYAHLEFIFPGSVYTGGPLSFTEGVSPDQAAHYHILGL